MIKYFIILIIFFTPTYLPAASLEYQIAGINKTLSKNILASLSLKQQIDATLTKDAINQLFQTGPDEIKRRLQAWGYFKPKISSSLTYSEKTQDHWIANYSIQLGPQLHINKIEIKLLGAGKSENELKKYLVTPLLQAGQPLITENYNKIKKEMLSTAEKLGYLDAELIVHKIQINLSAYTSTIILHLNTGPQYYIGPLLFSKNPLNREFLTRFSPFKTSEIYTNEKIFKLQENLNNSQYFQQVIVTPNRKKTKNYHIPLNVTLIPRKSQQYSFGVGYGTDTGPRASIGWDWRYITDTGHHLSSLMSISPIQNTLQSVYVIPGKNPLTEQYNLSASMLKNSFPRGENNIASIGIASIQQIKQWTQTLALNKQYEHYRFDNQPNYRDSTLLLPSITWQKMESDNPQYPLNGYRVSVNVLAAAKTFFSDTNLVQFTATGKYIGKLNENSRLLLRGELGYTAIHNPSAELPLSISYFAGGSRSVRGYSYQALGPGRYLFTSSIEYQYQFIKNWNAALFFDTGNAFQHIPDSQKLIKSLQQGLGMGVVWISPLGPINLSVAKAINWPGQPLQIQFSMGPDL